MAGRAKGAYWVGALGLFRLMKAGEPSCLRGGGEGRAENGIERILPPWASKNGQQSQWIRA